MKNAEFVALLTANTNKTKNLRTYTGKWTTGAARVPDKITTQIGHIVALLQNKIGEICNPTTEGLLVYNFQPILFHEDILYCSMDMLIRPLQDLDNTKSKIGMPVQVTISGTTHEVSNTTKGLLDIGLITPEEAGEMDPPKIFGKFTDFQAICGFIAISCQNPLESDPLFYGELNNKDFVKSCTGHDSFVQAKQALADAVTPFQYIGELIYPKERLPELLNRGIGKYIIKVMNPKGQEIFLSPVVDTLNKEINAVDEIRLYDEAILESPTLVIQNTGRKVLSEVN